MMPLTCPEFEQRLHEWLDARAQELPADLRSHAMECAACGQLLADWKRTATAIAAWKIVEPPSGLNDVILTRVRSANDTTLILPRSTTALPMRRSTGMVAAMFAAAALFLILGIGWRVSQTASITRLEPLRWNVVERSRDIETEPDLRNLLHDARNAYAALASEAWQQVSAANVLLPSANVPQIPADDAMHHVPDSLTRPLVPIRTELREVWDSLMDRVFSNSQDSST